MTKEEATDRIHRRAKTLAESLEQEAYKIEWQEIETQVDRISGMVSEMVRWQKDARAQAGPLSEVQPKKPWPRAETTDWRSVLFSAIGLQNSDAIIQLAAKLEAIEQKVG